MSRTDVSPAESHVSDGWSPRMDGLLTLAGAAPFAGLVLALHFLKQEFRPRSQIHQRVRSR